jgi:hypothetical protein
MSYAAQADLSTDEGFAGRLAAAVTGEAKPLEGLLAEAVLRSPVAGAQMFTPFVASEPGFADAYLTGGQLAITDGMILSAVQANWARVEGIYFPPPPDPA